VEFLRADRALLSPTKYQVELDSMRLVAEQIQQESEEKIQMLQRENNRLQDEMDRLQQGQLQMQQQMDKEEKDRLHQQQQDDIWKHLFYTLLEQICLLEESGLRADASLRMDHVVRDVVTGIQEEQVRQLDTFMERLAKGCGRSHVSESTVTTNHGKSNGSSLQDSASNGKYVSVAVDTEDLMSMGLFSSATTLTSHVNGSMHWQQTISDLQLENVSLKGSNEHMRGQLHRSRQEIQALRESLSKSGSAISALTEKCRKYANSMNQQVLEQQNAELLQEIKILSENQKVVEEENRRVVQRCVELEAVAEDATDECEDLVARLAEMERELRQVRDERDNLLTSHEDYENATTEREEEHRKIRDEMTEKCQSLEAKCNSLLEAKDELEHKMEMMDTLKVKLDRELDIMRKTIEGKDTQISSLESQLAQMQKQLCSEEDKFTEFSKEVKVLKEENTHLHDQQESLRKRQQGVADLEDECSRLRNLNGMIKAKIEITNSELHKIKTQNASLVQQLASVRSECDALRIENVALSDNKSDMEVDMRRYEKECEEQKTLTSKVEKELGKVITIRDELQKQNSSLRKQLQDCEGAKSALEKNLEALQTESYTLRGGSMSPYDTVVVKLPESEKRVTNTTIRQPNPSPHAYVSTPVGVQSPDTILGDTVTPATWSARSTGPLSGPSANNIDPVDDQLQRIQAAKEKATLILKNISNFRIKQGTSAKFEEPTSHTTILTAEKDKKRNSLNKTEAFVHNILDSCGK
jgi:Chromosome segregation ATPases